MATILTAGGGTRHDVLTQSDALTLEEIEASTSLEGKVASADAVKQLNSDLSELKISKQNNINKGSFSINTTANTAVEINADTIIKGSLPQTRNTAFTVTECWYTTECFNDIYYDGNALLVYSNKSQRITVFWFNFD